MQAIDFNDGWSYRHLDADESFTAVRLPHDAMIGEPRHEDAPGGVNTGWFDGRDYEYVKTYAPGPELAGRLLLLEFEGVYHNAEVWVDGAQLVFRPYGYTNFRVDVTDALAAGEPHEIRVVANAQAVTRDIQTTGRGGEADVVPQGALAAALDAGANAVAVACIEVPDAALWDCDHPNLYRCVVRFAGDDGSRDESETTFGVRTLAWGDDGLLLNGRRVIIQGACIHHDNGVLGACAYADAVERKVRLLRACGYNAVRSAHNPCSRALLDVCDRLGVLVMDEYIDHWYIHKTQHDYVDYFNDWWRRDLNDMVRKDRSHPSVVLYSTGNEVSETAQPKGIALTQAMTDHLHGLDPTRPVTCGVNIFFNFLSSIGMGVYSDDKAAKEAAEAEKRRAAGESQKKHKAVGSEFFNNMAGLLGADFMKTGATLPFCDWKTRDAFAAMDMAGYNYGIKRYRHDLRAYPHRLILGSETFCSDAYRFRELAKREPRLVGDFVWAGIDYLGEAGVGWFPPASRPS